MIILHNFHGLVDTYLPIMNYIVFLDLEQHVSAATPLTRISIFQVLRSSLFSKPHLELADQDKKGVTQQVFGQCTKDCEKVDICLPRNLTVLGLPYILLPPT